MQGLESQDLRVRASGERGQAGRSVPMHYSRKAGEPSGDRPRVPLGCWGEGSRLVHVARGAETSAALTASRDARKRITETSPNTCTFHTFTVILVWSFM